MYVTLRRSIIWILNLARQVYNYFRSFFPELFGPLPRSKSDSIKATSSPLEPPAVDGWDGDEPQPDHPDLKRLRRQATLELFDWLGLTHVPGQFWSLVDSLRDPISALAEFARGIGCDFQKIRRRDPEEIERFQNVIDFLQLAGPSIEAMTALQQKQFQEKLRQGNYDELMRLAKLLADLQGLLRSAAAYETDPTLHVFRSFVQVVRELASEPFAVTEAEVSEARKRASAYTPRIEEFRLCYSIYHDALDSFENWFRPEWKSTSREAEIIKFAGHAEECIEKLAGNDFGFDELDEWLARLRVCVDGVSRHKRDSETEDYYDHDHDTRAGRSRPYESRIGWALKCLGFVETAKPDCGQLRTAWRKFMQRFHPDKFASDKYSDEDRRGAHERAQQANEAYELLRVQFGCP
jgi:hypothetical protein